MYTLDSFRLDLRRSVAPDNHIWVSSGFGTVAPAAGTVCGVRGFFSPPFAAADMALAFSFAANGHAVPDSGSRGKEDVGLLFSGAEWRPDRIARRGTYHFSVDGAMLSFSVESELAAFVSRHGFAVRVRATNRAATPLELRLDADVTVGHPRNVPFGPGWNFCPPRAFGPDSEAIDEGVWETPVGVRCTLLGDAGTLRHLAPGATAEWCIGLEFANSATTGVAEVAGVADVADVEPPSVTPVTSATSVTPATLLDETHTAWSRRIETASASLPTLRSDLPGLEAYWNRSIASGLVCLWENPAFVVSPFPTTSGIDGGSLCCYPWDAAGYSARFLVAMLGERTRDLLKALLGCGIEKHICMTLSGEGEGMCSYSYSLWSILNFYWTMLTHLGIGGELFDDVLHVFLTDEGRLPDVGELKDYGVQKNLLEMRSAGYEHVVPSPNAERAWGFDRLADIAERLGRPGAEAWRAKAARIREAIRRDLWDRDAGWFRCRHPDHDELVYSVQMFDAMRFGACTEDMVDALVSHVRDGAFLGRYGVSSVSAEDAVHYEVNDPDWSGSGSYSGEGPQLAETLWKCGRDALAWDVLSRHFWMGEMLPYIPQEHSCDRPATPAHKRANIISGVAGYEAILHGMAGVQPQLDGSLRIAPHPHPDGFVEFTGIRHRGRSIDLRFTAQRMEVSVNGETRYAGPCGEVAVL